MRCSTAASPAGAVPKVPGVASRVVAALAFVDQWNIARRVLSSRLDQPIGERGSRTDATRHWS
jgi:hypothetical protein